MRPSAFADSDERTGLQPYPISLQPPPAIITLPVVSVHVSIAIGVIHTAQKRVVSFEIWCLRVHHIHLLIKRQGEERFG